MVYFWLGRYCTIDIYWYDCTNQLISLSEFPVIFEWHKQCLFQNGKIIRFSYTLWHMSTAVCKWRHLAHSKLLQFVNKKNLFSINKWAKVTNFSAGNQQMTLVVCQWVFVIFYFDFFLVVDYAKKMVNFDLRESQWTIARLEGYGPTVFTQTPWTRQLFSLGLSLKLLHQEMCKKSFKKFYYIFKQISSRLCFRCQGLKA